MVTWSPDGCMKLLPGCSFSFFSFSGRWIGNRWEVQFQIHHSPAPSRTKIISSPSGFASTCRLVWKPSCGVWESFHRAPPSPSRPAPYALTRWDESESTISKYLCKHWHFPLRYLQENGRKPNLYAAKPPLSGFVCHRMLQQRSRHCVSGSARATLAVCKFGVWLSYCTNFSSELSTVDIEYRSPQEKNKRPEKNLKILCTSTWKSRRMWWKQSVGVSHLPQVNCKGTSRPIRKKKKSATRKMP